MQIRCKFDAGWTEAGGLFAFAIRPETPGLICKRTGVYLS